MGDMNTTWGIMQRNVSQGGGCPSLFRGGADELARRFADSEPRNTNQFPAASPRGDGNNQHAEHAILGRQGACETIAGKMNE
jgi:hypothetical protein